MLNVLRRKPGDKVRLIDGKGKTGQFVIVETKKNRVTLSPIRIQEIAAPEYGLHLAMGWNKSVRRGWFLEKAVELGAAEVSFWQAERSQGKVPDKPKDSWLGPIIAGAKQSDSVFFPELKTFPGGINQVLEAKNSFDRCVVLWESADSKNRLGPDIFTDCGRVMIVIGPEGGLETREVDRLTQAGFIPMSLGKRILRWETAALVCLSLNWWRRQHEF